MTTSLLVVPDCEPTASICHKGKEPGTLSYTNEPLRKSQREARTPGEQAQGSARDGGRAASRTRGSTERHLLDDVHALDDLAEDDVLACSEPPTSEWTGEVSDAT